MKRPKFERNKINRLIKTYGETLIFERDELNDLKEPTGEKEQIPVNGLFHQEVGHVTVLAQDSASLQTKPSPYVLALYEDGSKVKQGDMVSIGDNTYTVAGVTDFGNWGIAVDISLEVKLYGKIS